MSVLQLTYADSGMAYVDAEDGRSLGLRAHNGTENKIGLTINTDGSTTAAGQLTVNGSIVGKSWVYACPKVILRNTSNTQLAQIAADGYLYLDTLANGGLSGIRLRINGSTNGLTVLTDGQLQFDSVAKHSTTSSANLRVGTGTGAENKIYIVTSLRKFKTDIQDVTEEEANLGYKLRPRSFKGINKNDDDFTQYGFIAEEVEEVLPYLAQYDTQGLQGVAYDRVAAINTKQLQLQKQTLDSHKLEIQSLKQEILNLKKELDSLKNKL